MFFKQKSSLINKVMGTVLDEELKMKLQKIFYVTVRAIYIVNGVNEFKMIEPKIECRLIPITLDNYHRVVEFREERRIAEYRDKLLHNEIGVFAEHEGKMIGSIWASINQKEMPCVVKTFFKLMPNEALLHDVVTSEKVRRMGVGAFLESGMPAALFKEYGISKMITDVNVRNHASLGMLAKVGFQVDHKRLLVSVFGKSVLQLALKKYA
jgi:RimJ/RimL family protein N-acetyltransferase